ncbi:hypothetical protein [Methyloligella solikamskensis]|uniref:Right handed beta helix domain-containing protein n=1 Tax=Methyloligella solikamskensis TaxID=1177756 RepID=A0ABW3JD40_9HYPH
MFAGALVAAGFAAPAYAAELLVTTSADSGPGSLRDALAEAAKGEGDAQIFVTTGDDIEIETPLVYEGTAPLGLYGSGQVIKSDKNVNLLSVSNGADLTVNNLSFQGPGGFSLEHRGDTDGPAGKGIFIGVPQDRTGIVHLDLQKVSVSDVAGHGVHVSDCSLADACGNGGGGAGSGSPASVSVRLTDVEISNAGQGRFDGDGLRVDERSEGDIVFHAQHSKFTGMGADGVELDEGEAGSVIATAIDSAFNENGTYCDPKLLKSFLPKDAKGKFEDGEMAEADVPPAITGSPDDACIEREVKLYESGSVKKYEIAIDLDDGFDIDEAGEGDLIAVLSDLEVKDNKDEGIDFDEADAGKVSFAFRDGEVEGQTDDGVKISEEGADGVTALVHDVSSKKNGGKGVVFEQEDEGDIDVVVVKLETSGNDHGDKTGLEVVQDGDGKGTLIVRDSNIEDGIDAEGVEVKDETMEKRASR